MELNKNYVSYEDFGAVGDGKTDDMPAIVKAHEYANENKLPVKAKDGATYYIGGKDITAVIKTDVDFGGATFIIDDRILENRQSEIFKVESDFPTYTPDITSVAAGQKKIDFPHEGKTYVRVFNSENKVFKRMGENASNGTDANDCFVVDGEGNILTDINLDYPKVTKAYAKCVEDAPLVVEGGKFITYANCAERMYNYHKRGFYITRSNVTVQNLTHLIEKEGPDGAPYAGFLTSFDTVDVTIKDCLLTPHKTYMTKDSNPPTYVNRMGSYDLNFAATIGTKLIGVSQSRDILDRSYWGLIGTNFCKEMYLDGCEMSRFDAHMGVTHATVKNCRIGHMCLQLIGYGEFYIENSTILGDSFVGLRGDYGSTWTGNITIKDCVWIPKNKNALTVISASNPGTHDFGYAARMPEKLVIDGLKVLDSEINEGVNLYILPIYDPEYAPGKPYAYIPTKKLLAKGVVSECGRVVQPYAIAALYPDLEYEIN